MRNQVMSNKKMHEVAGADQFDWGWGNDPKDPGTPGPLVDTCETSTQGALYSSYVYRWCVLPTAFLPGGVLTKLTLGLGFSTRLYFWKTAAARYGFVCSNSGKGFAFHMLTMSLSPKTLFLSRSPYSTRLNYATSCDTALHNIQVILSYEDLKKTLIWM
jgi:hypothetical protein